MDKNNKNGILSSVKDCYRFVARKPITVLGLVILSLFVFLAILGPLITPMSPFKQNLSERMRPPAWATNGKVPHLLGTDYLGRDILSRIIYGTRVSLTVAIASVALAGGVGLILGMIAGYFRGAFDHALTQLVNTQLSFPFILLAMTLSAFLERSLVMIVIVIAVTTWVVYCRVARAITLSVREMTYIEAARAIGVSNISIIGRHVFRNIIGGFIVIGTLEIGRVIILESALSFLGLGVPPDVPSWGTMLADGRAHMFDGWWLSTFPGLAIMLLVLSINITGDWLRDVLDPRLKNRYQR